MKSKHTDYYGLLEALQEPTCALCRSGLRAVDRFFDGLLYESVNDVQMRERLKAAHGFCAVHSAALAQRHDSLGASILYRSILNHLSDALAAIETPAEQGVLRRVRQQFGGADLGETPLAPQGPCPACSSRDQAVQRALSLIADHQDDPDLLQALRRSDGFCLPHLRLSLARLPDTARRQLINRQQEVWQGLSAELSEAIRKHDARFQKEAWGAEEDAWRRAIEATSGVPGVF